AGAALAAKAADAEAQESADQRDILIVGEYPRLRPDIANEHHLDEENGKTHKEQREQAMAGPGTGNAVRELCQAVESIAHAASLRDGQHRKAPEQDAAAEELQDQCPAAPSLGFEPVHQQVDGDHGGGEKKADDE